ncbi:MAG: hypothetical protein H0W72_18280, partial [Planctomycetes bacterium]|nr:hypothetical protein [Planctomycetota bacterium]
LRLEPRIAAEMISEAAVCWASGVVVAGDQPLAVMAAPPAGEPDHDPATAQGHSQVQVDHLPPGLERFRLDGQLLFKLRRRVHAEATLAGEGPVQLALGRSQFSATLMVPVDQERGGVRLVYRSGTFEGLEVVLSGADGRPLQQAGRNSRSSHPRTDETWLFTGIDLGKPYTLSLAYSEVLAQPILPIAAAVELP